MLCAEPVASIPVAGEGTSAEAISAPTSVFSVDDVNITVSYVGISVAVSTDVNITVT